MTNKTVADSLKFVLADTYALYLKTQNYHWNVTSPHFKSLHLLFEEQYTNLATAVDAIAERIRSLGDKAPGSFDAYKKLTHIQDGDENAEAQTMLKQLADDQAILLASLKKALNHAQAANDEVTVDLLIDRMGVHELATWMLKSSL